MKSIEPSNLWMLNPLPIDVTLASPPPCGEIALRHQPRPGAPLMTFLAALALPAYSVYCGLADSGGNGCVPSAGAVTRVLFPGRQQENGGRQLLPDASFLPTPRGEQGGHLESKLQQCWGAVRQLPGCLLHIYTGVLHKAHPEWYWNRWELCVCVRVRVCALTYVWSGPGRSWYGQFRPVILLVWTLF